MGRTQTSTRTIEHDGERGGEADLPVREGEAVDLEAGHGGRAAGAAAGGDVDDVEAGQRGDDGDRDADADLLAQARQGDRAELVPAGPAPSMLGRLVQRGVDLAHAGDEQHGAQPEQHPGADDADRRQRDVEVAEPGRVTPPRPTALSSWLTRPVEASSQLHVMPAATSGMTCGRNSTVRATVPSRPPRCVRISWRDREPEQTGMTLKKTIELERVDDGRRAGRGR